MQCMRSAFEKERVGGESFVPDGTHPAFSLERFIFHMVFGYGKNYQTLIACGATFLPMASDAF